MKKKSEKQKDLDNLKTELAKVSTVILTTFQGITVQTTPNSAAKSRKPAASIRSSRTRLRSAPAPAHPPKAS